MAQKTAGSTVSNNVSAGPVSIRPAIFADPDARRLLQTCARALERSEASAELVGQIRTTATTRARSLAPNVAPEAMLAASVLCDLRAQGWHFRVARQEIVAVPPRPALDAQERKSQVRAAHLLERDSQLRQPAVRRFIRDLERRRLFAGEWHSIFSLMRDGRELAASLSQVTEIQDETERQRVLAKAIDPYVQVVNAGERCSYTGLLLMDVWRYFRHTWATTYNNTPGRKMFFLIRDSAVPRHPVIGIGALGSAVVQLRKRDTWIGWTPSTVLAELRAEPSSERARWVLDALERMLREIRTDDLLRTVRIPAASLRAPTEPQIRRLLAFAKANRERHQRYPERARHKSVSGNGAVNWREQSSTYLFRAKRAEQLAELLEARRRLITAGFTQARAAQLARALRDRDATSAITTVLKRIKASAIGVSVMDINVCGAIAPYNAVLGGKLVALLMASPAVTRAYKDRYQRTASVIASSMAGRAIRKSAELVLLGTTSLYDVSPAQYNRLKVPAEAFDGECGDALDFMKLGETEGYGSYQFSQQTLKLITPVVARTRRGRVVNSIFGEGVSPKFRKVRQALDAIGFPANELLQHGSPRLIYQVPLASNFRQVLLGYSEEPRYIVPQTPEGTTKLIAFWRERWLSGRVRSAAVLEAIARHTCTYPVEHGGRVSLPPLADEYGPLFEEACADA